MYSMKRLNIADTVLLLVFMRIKRAFKIYRTLAESGIEIRVLLLSQ